MVKNIIHVNTKKVLGQIFIYYAKLSKGNFFFHVSTKIAF